MRTEGKSWSVERLAKGWMMGGWHKVTFTFFNINMAPLQNIKWGQQMSWKK